MFATLRSAGRDEPPIDWFIELLHPEGAAAQALDLDHAPEKGSSAHDRPWDIVVLRASRDHMEWTDGEFAALRRRLSSQALVYVDAPAGLRGRAVGALCRRGLLLELTALRLRRGPQIDYVVSLESRVIRFVLHTTPIRSLFRRFALLASSMPSLEFMVGVLAPRVICVLRAPTARPLLERLAGSQGGGPGDGVLIMRKACRTAGAVTLMRLDRNGVPSSVTKASAIGSGTCQAEAQRLRRLGDSAARAGAAVPIGSMIELPNGRPALHLTAIPGRPLDAVLAAHPDRLHETTSRIGGWLTRWHELTIRARMNAADGVDPLCRRAAALTPLLPNGAEYLRMIATACEHPSASGVPIVATHNDLTMSNVLLDGERLGVVDWESATPEGLPLTDFLYAAWDARAAVERYRNRLQALLAVRDVSTAYGASVRTDASAVARRIGFDVRWIDLAWHLMVLHHACNEHAEGREERPFIAAAQYLAREAAEGRGLVRND